jgi:hypothetical protein
MSLLTTSRSRKSDTGEDQQSPAGFAMSELYQLPAAQLNGIFVIFSASSKFSITTNLSSTVLSTPVQQIRGLASQPHAGARALASHHNVDYLPCEARGNHKIFANHNLTQ